MPNVAEGRIERVIPFKSVGEARLGMTFAQVLRIHPSLTVTPGYACGGTRRGHVSYCFPSRSRTVQPGDRLASMAVRGGRYSLANGLGIGTRLASARKRMPDLRCWNQHPTIGSATTLEFDLRLATGELYPASCGIVRRTSALSGRFRRCDSWIVGFSGARKRARVGSMELKRDWYRRGKQFRTACVPLGCDPQAVDTVHKEYFTRCVELRTSAIPREEDLHGTDYERLGCQSYMSDATCRKAHLEAIERRGREAAASR